MFCAIFARVSGIFIHFAQISRDFAQIFRDYDRIFDKSKLSGVRCIPLHSRTTPAFPHSRTTSPLHSRTTD